jgi:SAM-dependent methyltransferase
MDSVSSEQGQSSPKRIKIRAMSEEYWDEAAEVYEEEILDNLNVSIQQAKKQGKISPLMKALDTYKNPSVDAVDFGCGPGKHLAVLSKRFRRVLGVDWSRKLVDMAKTAVKKCKNVQVRKLNLGMGLKPKDIKMMRSHGNNLSQKKRPQFGLCTNVLIMPSERVQQSILTNIYKTLGHGAICVFLVPSLESALFCQCRLRQWSASDSESYGIPCNSSTAAKKILKGIIPRDGVDHKHWLKEAFMDKLRANGFQALSAERVEYSWDTEFSDEAPEYVTAAPYPYDWLIVARRDGRN